MPAARGGREYGRDLRPRRSSRTDTVVFAHDMHVPMQTLAEVLILLVFGGTYDVNEEIAEGLCHGSVSAVQGSSTGRSGTQGGDPGVQQAAASRFPLQYERGLSSGSGLPELHGARRSWVV